MRKCIIGFLVVDNMFHIPIKDITAHLDHYFEHYSIDPTKIHGYFASEDAVIISTIAGFGGDVWTKVRDKKFNHDKFSRIYGMQNELKEIELKMKTTKKFTTNNEAIETGNITRTVEEKNSKVTLANPYAIRGIDYKPIVTHAKLYTRSE